MTDETDAATARFDARWKTLGFGALDPSARRQTLRGAVDRAAIEATLAAPMSVGLDATMAAPHAEAPTSVTKLPTLEISEGAGDRAGELEIVRRLGEGGMGVVDLGRQRSLAREVALKRLREGSRDATHAAALLHEARVMGRLEHPNVVPVHALGADAAGRPVLVMKRIEGTAWSTLLEDAQHPLWSTLTAAGEDRLEVHVAVLQQVCNALEFAHARGVIHRDVKPENVMLGAYGEVYLLDWGVALDRGALDEARADAKQTVGTPCFMAPELFDGPVRTHDERTDVYLLGATLHAVLTGKPRHEGETLLAVMLSAARSEPFCYANDVAPELAALCNASTSRERAARPSSVAAFRHELTAYLRRRGSRALARSARELLDRVVAMPSGSHGSTDARRLVSEAHFGFTQALRAWDGNAAAREGLCAGLELAFARELSQQNVEAARALLRELDAHGASTDTQREALAACERAALLEKTQAERARETERQMDSSTSARERAWLVGVGALVLTAVSFALSWARSGDRATGDPSVHDLLRTDALVLLFYAVAIAIGRRKLLANVISRRLTLSLGMLLAGGLFTDGIAALMRIELGAAVVQKFVVGGFVLATGALAIDGALVVPAVLSLGAALVMARNRETMALVGNGATLLVVGSFIWIALRKARAGGAPAAR